MAKKNQYKYYGATTVEQPDRWVEPDDVDEYPIEVQLDDWSVIEVRNREMHELLDECHVKWSDREEYKETPMYRLEQKGEDDEKDGGSVIDGVIPP